jgi:hypothetical protein
MCFITYEIWKEFFAVILWNLIYIIMYRLKYSLVLYKEIKLLLHTVLKNKTSWVLRIKWDDIKQERSNWMMQNF